MEEFRSSGPRAEYHGFGIQALIERLGKVRPNQIALAAGVSRSTVYPMMAMECSARIYDIVALAPKARLRPGTSFG